MLRIEDILDDAARYLRGEMDAEEKIFFEELLQQHAHLREDVRFMDLTRQGLDKINKERFPSGRSQGIQRQKILKFVIYPLIILLIISLCLWLSSPMASEVIIRPKANSATLVPSTKEAPAIIIEQLGADSYGSNSDRGHAVKWMRSGSICFAGTFIGRGELGGLSFKSKGDRDMIFGVYSEKAGFEWLAVIGGKESADVPKAIAIDTQNGIFLTGGFGGTVDFGGTQFKASAFDDLGQHEYFVAKYTPAGVLQWMDHAGGTRIDDIQTGTNTGLDIVIDHVGDIIVSGAYIGSPEFQGKKLPTGSPGEDLFLSKYSNTGIPRWTQPITSKYMVYGKSLAIDKDNNIYLSGTFGHPVLGGELYLGRNTIIQSHGGRDLFLAKYDNTGKFLWAKSGGSQLTKDGYDEANGVVVDTSGNSYITGTFTGTAQFGEKKLTTYGGRDIFLIKYNPKGQVMWATQAGSALGSGSHNEQANAIAIAPNGEVVITGSFTDTARFGDKKLETNGLFNFFIARYNPNGELIWVRQFNTLKGFQCAQGNGIDINEEGKIVVTGFFSGNIEMDGQILSSKGKEDIFLLIMNPDGNIVSAKHMMAYLIDE